MPVQVTHLANVNAIKDGLEEAGHCTDATKRLLCLHQTTNMPSNKKQNSTFEKKNRMIQKIIYWQDEAEEPQEEEEGRAKAGNGACFFYKGYPGMTSMNLARETGISTTYGITPSKRSFLHQKSFTGRIQQKSRGKKTKTLRRRAEK